MVVLEKHEPASQLRLVQLEFSQATAYTEGYGVNAPKSHFFNTRLRRVGELLGDLEAGRVLDVGCGPAMVGRLFLDRPIQYFGVDASEEMLRECVKTFGGHPQFHFSLGRIEKLSFPDSHFEVVLCLGAFEYLLDGKAGMKEIARVAKDNGIVIVSMHNPHSPYRLGLHYGYDRLRNAWNRIGRLRERRGNRGEEKHQRPAFAVYTEKAMRRLFSSAGLQVEDVVYYDFNLLLPPLNSLFPNASLWVRRNLEFLCRGRLKLLGYGYLMRGRKMVG